MAKLPITMVVVVCMALVLGAISERNSIKKRDTIRVVQTNDITWVCATAFSVFFSECATTTTTSAPGSSTTNAPGSSTTQSSSTSAAAGSSSTKSGPISIIRPQSSSKGSTTTDASSTSAGTSTAINFFELISVKPLNSNKSSTDGSASSSTDDSASSSTDGSASSSTAAPTYLESAHWCRFSNGTYLPLGYIFMYTECALCQCVRSRSIQCVNLQCVPTYCIDGTVAERRSGQCCPQCAYESQATTCVQNNITFPNGAIIQSTSDGVQCWCQSGSVECRKTVTSVFTSMDMWGQGSAVYVVVIIIVALLLLGTLLCAGCTLFYYYYYKRNQESMQQAYDQYWNTAGWQPMSEEEQQAAAAAGIVDGKEAEAEQSQVEQVYPTGGSQEYIPPPYALYNGGYVAEENKKDQKFM